MQRILGTVAVLMMVAFAGCASDDSEPTDDEAPVARPTRGEVTRVDERIELPFNVTGPWSETLFEGAYDILAPRSIFVDIELPLTEGGSALNPADEAMAHLGLFLPDIPGCDWDASDLPEECHVPVIADAGPYYGESDVEADERGSGRLGEFLITNFVPHGYAVAQISVMGSGQSTHCFDMFGLAEQLGVSQSVEWLGDQPWSNGAVGLIGRSYDGSTPWMAAAHAPEDSALKTIVPISGLTGLQDLVTWNGASESRILTFHNVIYGTFGVEPGAELPNQLLRRATCPDWVTATPWGVAGYLTGDEVLDVEGTYWQERNFLDRVIENYRGSLYMIHGLRDNNVDPHAGWPGHKLLDDAGLDTKGLYGQWFHSYPDRPGEHGDSEPRNSVRYDWAQDLLEWFDHYLKGTGAQPVLGVEVQMQDGRWRLDDGLQPSNAAIVDVAVPAPAQPVAATQTQTLDLGVLDPDAETILGGLSTLTLDVTPTGPGGQVYVELIDATDDESFGLSYGVMELRHAGGQPVPGQSMTIEIPLQYFSGALEAGHSLGLRISGSGNGFLPSPVVLPVSVTGGTLHLSTVDAAPGHFFEPPIWFE